MLTETLALFADQENARLAMQHATRLFTDTSVEGHLAPKIRYSLRGVATKPSTYYNVTYSLYPRPYGSGTGSAESMNWWKITYDGETSSASIEKEVRLPFPPCGTCLEGNACGSATSSKFINLLRSRSSARLMY